MFTLSFLPTLLIAALCLPAIGAAQTDPGSLDILLGADFEPLQKQTVESLPELNAPLVIVPPVPRPQAVLPQPESVIELPRIAVDEPALGQLVLPDLTMPTPENTVVDSLEDRRSLKPQFEVRPQDPVELLPFDNRSIAQPQPHSVRPQPRLQSPQALNYGSGVYSSRSRIQVVPIQVEFYSVNRGYGYQPYGGYRSGYKSGYRPSYGNYGRPPARYSPYGGGSRPCPYGR